jgi:hypothetical protein
VLQSFEIGQTIFYVDIYGAKLSLLFFNRRITSFTTGWWTKVHYTLLTLIASFGIFSIVTVLFPCRPVAAHFSLLSLVENMDNGLRCWDTLVQDNIQVASRAL